MAPAGAVSIRRIPNFPLSLGRTVPTVSRPGAPSHRSGKGGWPEDRRAPARRGSPRLQGQRPGARRPGPPLIRGQGNRLHVDIATEGRDELPGALEAALRRLRKRPPEYGIVAFRQGRSPPPATLSAPGRPCAQLRP